MIVVSRIRENNFAGEIALPVFKSRKASRLEKLFCQVISNDFCSISEDYACAKIGLSMDTALASRKDSPIRYSSTFLAHSLPSLIAHTTRLCPLRISPAVNTLGILVWKDFSPALTFPRSSSSTPSSSNKPLCCGCKDVTARAIIKHFIPTCHGRYIPILNISLLF